MVESGIVEHDQAEHEHISTALEVERIDTNLYRSKSLWLPVRARGVFGGQVISQAVVSATKSVDAKYSLHSLHCYFLLSASPAIPILYYVERLREGRSYTTRSVKAVQDGQIVFILLCSFQSPEPWQPSHQWKMPANVPHPDECELEEERFIRAANKPGLHEKFKSILLAVAAERTRSPISVKTAKEHIISEGGTITYMYWMKARNIPAYGAPFQKSILSYLSDMYFISVGARILGLKRFARGPDALSMTSSLDHSIFFYDDNFDCGDWLLYVIVSPRTGSGRGIMNGSLYTQNGTLVAVTSQEGVIRANRRESSAKL